MPGGLLSLPSRAEALLGKLEKGELVTRDPQLSPSGRTIRRRGQASSLQHCFCRSAVRCSSELPGWASLVLAACLGFGAGLALLGVIWRRKLSQHRQC